MSPRPDTKLVSIRSIFIVHDPSREGCDVNSSTIGPDKVVVVHSILLWAIEGY